MTDLDNLSALLARLDADQGRLARLDRYYKGTQPAAFMSSASSDALAGRLPSLVVNIPRLACSTLANRLALAGFLRDGQLDPAFAAAWRIAGGDSVSDKVHLGALVDGRSYALCWVAGSGRLSLTAEAARSIAVEKDAASGEIIRAVKVWSSPSANGVLPATAYASVFERDRITKWTGPSTGTTAAGWTLTETLPNPLGVVPVVEFLNRGRVDDLGGFSEIEDIAGLTDAVSKLTQDAMVASELAALPRRVITGIQIPVDPVTGQRLNPARGLAADNMLTITNENAKVASWPAADLRSYPDLLKALTTQLGAITGLPGHLLGLLGDQPASADALRASEQALVERAIARQRSFGPSWEAVARLVVAITENAPVGSVDIEAQWTSPETRSPAADADSIVKLVSAGVPLALALQRHGWGAEENRPRHRTHHQPDRSLTMPETENTTESPGTESDATEPNDTETETAPPEPDTFPRAYVESLRRESAEHRTRAADRDQLAQRLQATLVARTGRLVEGADDLVPFDEAHLTDPDSLSAALDALLEARPYLAKTQRPSGDVGQGRGAAPAPFSLIDALRGQG